MEANGTSNMTSDLDFFTHTNKTEDEVRDVKTLAMSYIVFKIGKYLNMYINSNMFKYIDTS